jgi:DNA-binding CsgD family transcriptional regulator
VADSTSGGRPSGDGEPILNVLGADLRHALDAIGLAVYVLDAGGIVRWSNKAAAAITGSGLGESYLRLIAPEHRPRGKIHFARTVVGGTAAEFALTVVGRSAPRVDVRVHAAPLRHRSAVIGAIGIVMRLDDETHAQTARGSGTSAVPDLTPRQVEVLGLLAEGLNTREIAGRLGVAVETARNHIRALLRRLGVHSRLEAVIVARRHGLVSDSSFGRPHGD